MNYKFIFTLLIIIQLWNLINSFEWQSGVDETIRYND